MGNSDCYFWEVEVGGDKQRKFVNCTKMRLESDTSLLRLKVFWYEHNFFQTSSNQIIKPVLPSPLSDQFISVCQKPILWTIFKAFLCFSVSFFFQNWNHFEETNFLSLFFCLRDLFDSVKNWHFYHLEQDQRCLEQLTVIWFDSLKKFIDDTVLTPMYLYL